MIKSKSATGLRILTPIFLILFAFSCSIIEDSDLQSQKEVDTKLKLGKIIFIEQVNGSDFNPEALGIGGETSINSLGQISKINWYGGIVINDPFNDVSMMRFNYIIDSSKPFPYSISSNITYNSDGRPTKITQVDEVNDFQFQSFEFTYNSQGKMATMVTTRNSNGGTLNQKITDVITYENEKIASVNRTTVDLNTMDETYQTITLTRRSSGLIREIKFDFLNGSHRFFDQHNENNADSYFYFSQLTEGNVSGDPSGNPVVIPAFSDVIQSMQLIDSRVGNGQILDPDRNPDVFFIHPLLILPDLFNDFELSQIFINDWWVGSSIRDFGGYETDRIAHVFYEYEVY